MRKIFTNELPTIKSGTNKGKFDWKNSIGYIIPFIYDDLQGELEVIEYCLNNQKIKIKYNKREFYITTNALLKARFGRSIGKIKYSKDFIFDIDDEIIDNNRNIKIFDRWYDNNNKKRWYKYQCLICGYKNGKITEGNLVRGKGCSCCSSRVVVKGINDISTTAPWMIKYFQGGLKEAEKYTRSSNKFIYPVCPDCGKIKDKQMSVRAIFSYQSINCQCTDGKSYPEKFMSSILDQLKIKYIWGFRPDWLRGYKEAVYASEFDFYLPELNLIVEMDGGIGHGKRSHPNSNVTSKESKEKDDWKDLQAVDANLNVIRINSDKSNKNYLKNNIEESLKLYLDFSNVDWDLANENATKNIIRLVCEYYENNKNKQLKDIGAEFKLKSATTVRSYLKQGKLFGWCTYSVDESLCKKIEEFKQMNSDKLSKRVAVYENDILLKEYVSASECVKNSLEDFGIKFLLTGVCLSARTKSKIYKGYSFEYINKIKN